jgi:hypothetical protein
VHILGITDLKTYEEYSKGNPQPFNLSEKKITFTIDPSICGEKYYLHA